MKTVREMAACGGHGDRIMATGGDPDRPSYILSRTKVRDTFNPDFRVAPGRIEIAPEHVEWARKYVPRDKIMVEPHVKGRHSADNKAWDWRRWQALANAVPAGTLLQCVPPCRAGLQGISVIVTPSFAHAVAALAQSRGLVTTEGGLHHAAAALGKPAVVLFGAFNLPENFGYADHVNIHEPDPEGLGQRKSHPACRAAMERITVARVLEAMERAFAPA
jgi:ADP-heptose:LPS heptosyltransferase